MIAPATTTARLFADARWRELPGARRAPVRDCARGGSSASAALGLPDPQGRGLEVHHRSAPWARAASRPRRERPARARPLARPPLVPEAPRARLRQRPLRAPICRRPAAPAAARAVQSLAERAARAAPRRLAELGLGQLADAARLRALNTRLRRRRLRAAPRRGAALRAPLQLLFVTRRGRAGAAHPRNADRRSRRRARSTWSSATSRVGDGRYLTNRVTEIVVGAGAALDHDQAAVGEAPARHIAPIAPSALGRRASTQSLALTLGGAWRATRSTPSLEGEGASSLNGAYLRRERQHADNTTLVDHAAPAQHQPRVYKGVLDDQARASSRAASWSGATPRRPTPTRTTRNLLLSAAPRSTPSRSWRSTPTTSSAATARPPASSTSDALFYLRARGITPRRARSLLISLRRRGAASASGEPVRDRAAPRDAAALAAGGRRARGAP